MSLTVPIDGILKDYMNLRNYMWPVLENKRQKLCFKTGDQSEYYPIYKDKKYIECKLKYPCFLKKTCKNRKRTKCFHE